MSVNTTATSMPAAGNDPLSRAQEVARIIPPLLRHPDYPEFFKLWERAGFHVSRAHFYSPIPNIGALPPETWRRKSSLPGIDMRDAEQLKLLHAAFPRFRGEYNLIPRVEGEQPDQYYFENGQFGGTDALVLYCMIRHFQPRRILEVGGGFSTLLAAQAAVRNGNTRLTCVDPYPNETLQRGFRGLESLIAAPIQSLDPQRFEELTQNDILFIDSSHVSKIGSDVNYLYLEVLPRLPAGVIIHVHDIFLPYEYPRGWVVDDLRFWTEQYLLQAFLAFNSRFEVLFANSYLEATYPGALREVFPNSPWWGGGSFWIRSVASRLQ